MALFQSLLQGTETIDWPATVGVIFTDRTREVQLPDGRRMSESEFKRLFPDAPLCRMASGSVDMNRGLRSSR